MKDLEFLVKDGNEGIGSAYAYHNGEHFIGVMSQDRLDFSIKNTEEMFDFLNETSKQFISTNDTEKQAIMETLDFWCLKECDYAVHEFDSFELAIVALKDSPEDFIVFNAPLKQDVTCFRTQKDY